MICVDRQAAGEGEEHRWWDDFLSAFCLLSSSSMEALKTLMQSTGYGDYVSYVQKLGGWELLTNPERHYEGVTLLAR